MTLDPRCEPLLEELRALFWHRFGIDIGMTDGEREDVLKIIDKHLCPCGHAYRKRSS